MTDDSAEHNNERPPPGLAVGDESGRPAARFQRYVWSRRVRSWGEHSSPALAKVTAAVLSVSAVEPGDVVLDLGCGTGQITIPLAERGADILGIDVSPAMAGTLRAEAGRRGLSRLSAATAPIERLDLRPASFDLIVSSYALHHLRDAEKARLVGSAYRSLRPGGQLVIADMMLGRGGTARDRAIIRDKLVALARKGPGGWWRIAKNSIRYAFRVQEQPISMAAWTRLFESAGFTSVRAAPIVAEAGLVTGERPGYTISLASGRGGTARAG
jgi:ubiquinone/menaquinone biosynthesis C-methylase UbiE